MNTVEEIEKAVERLRAADLAKFRAWFETFEAARFDKKIEGDIKSGKLDAYAETALADFRRGLAREL